VSRLLTAFESHHTVFRTEIDKLREHTDKLESTDSYIREAAKDVLDKFTLQAKHINQPQATDNNMVTIPVSMTGTNAPQTYAAAAQQGGTTQKPRQAILDKNQGRNRRIIIDAKGDDIVQLTEETLVTKANMTIELMKTNKHPDKPENAKFVSAKKLRNGGLKFEINSDKAAAWIKGDDIHKKLADNFGNSAEIRIHGFTVLVKNAPLYFQPEEDGDLTAVALANGMEEHDTIKARWMKPPECQHAKQVSAHVALTLRTAKAANEAIQWGVTIRGKRCIAEQLTKEATRCNKCQRYGQHFAAQCMAIHDTCGTCGSIEHAMKNCNVHNNMSKHKCVNCKENGHTAWSRDCPTLRKKNQEIMENSYKGGFKYFVTDDPSTWERMTEPHRII
jgi:hypothetical protein